MTLRMVRDATLVAVLGPGDKVAFLRGKPVRCIVANADAAPYLLDLDTGERHPITPVSRDTKAENDI